VAEKEESDNKSGAGLYLIGALVLAAGIGGIVYITRGSDKPAEPTAAPVKTENAPVNMAPPPPPPPPPTASATASASAAPDTSSTAHVAGGGGGGACSKCNEGVSNGSLNTALQGAAASARGCYNRVIQKNQGAAGRMNVSVQVGSTGQVCSAAITNDTVGNGEVSNCVLSRFQGKSFPRPDKGCVTVNIPLSFSVKE
jgi:hypothetical protein